MSHPRRRPLEGYQVHMLLAGHGGWTDVSIAERREVVHILSTREGMKAADIATMLGTTKRTVERARQALRNRERVITFPKENAA